MVYENMSMRSAVPPEVQLAGVLQVRMNTLNKNRLVSFNDNLLLKSIRNITYMFNQHILKKMRLCNFLLFVISQV